MDDPRTSEALVEVAFCGFLRAHPAHDYTQYTLIDTDRVHCPGLARDRDLVPLKTTDTRARLVESRDRRRED